jgi:hypothetical protein
MCLVCFSVFPIARAPDPPPYYQILPAAIAYGPGPAVGSVFYVNVTLASVSNSSNLIAAQFRLLYDSRLLTVVNVTEGRFMTNPIWNKYGTWSAAYDEIGDPIWGDHVLFGDLLLPNASGVWDQTTFPNTIESAPPSVDGTLARICFNLTQQRVSGANVTIHLDLVDAYLGDKGGNEITIGPSMNSTVTVNHGAGDVNCDGYVDGKDLTAIAWSFGSYTGSSHWNSVADENNDGKIDGKDLVSVGRNFGKTYG